MDILASVNQRFVIRTPWALDGFVMLVCAGTELGRRLINTHHVLHSYSLSLSNQRATLPGIACARGDRW